MRKQKDRARIIAFIPFNLSSRILSCSFPSFPLFCPPSTRGSLYRFLIIVLVGENRPRYSFIVEIIYRADGFTIGMIMIPPLTTWICGFFFFFFFLFFFLDIDSVDRAGLVLILFTGRLIKVVYSLLKKVGRYYDLIGCVLFGLMLVWTMIDFHFSHFNNRGSILINKRSYCCLHWERNIFKLICYLLLKICSTDLFKHLCKNLIIK